jgi:CSLREA domain-containing protein
MHRNLFSGISGILIILSLLFSGLPLNTAYAAGPVCYVNAGAAGSNNGTSWVNAYLDLQSALADAGCTQIWVADGTYKPTSGVDRTISFTLKDGVAIYGGFTGTTETLLTDRNPRVNITILSGDIAASPNQFDNSYHVVNGAGADNTAVLDGFTITKGYANGASTNSNGAGIYNPSGSDPILSNLMITDNYASGGGGMYNTSNSNPQITNVTLSLNTATLFGGGMYNNFSSPILTNVTFDSNDAGNEGGGMINLFSSAGSVPTLTNVTFSNNTSGDLGGGMYNSFSDPTATNVTFSNNSAVTNGGAIYNDSNSDIVISDGLFWGNGTEIYIFAGSTVTLLDGIVEGGCPAGATCTNVSNSDPLLGLLQDNAGYTETMMPGPGSPAIDAGGSNSVCAADDQRGMTRPQGAACDIGAVESTVQSGAALIVNVIADTDDGSCDALVLGLTDCSLRDAINRANGMGGNNSITFDPGLGMATIVLGSTLPTITEASQLTIDGGHTITLDGGLSHRVFNNNTGPGPVLILNNLTINRGLASAGGAIHNTASLTINNSTLSGNIADTGTGGAILNESTGSLTITNSTFSSNASGGAGGAIINRGTATAEITDSTFSQNSAGGAGGAIVNRDSATVEITNSTFSQNSAAGVGGGGVATSGTAATITNSTFSGNTVSAGTGGGIKASAGVLVLYNTLIANSPSGGDCVITAATVTAGNNLIEDASNACGLTNGVNGNITGFDPALGVLAGSPSYFLLNSGSKAMDAGSDSVCAAAPVNNASQNGVSRPVGAHCDIGSFEFIQTFADVPTSHPYWLDIEILYANGLTAGCSVTPFNFCPDQIMDRAQSSVFVLRGNFGTGYVPPVGPWNLFSDDWSAGAWAEKWAEGMYNAGLTAGCATGPLLYCPWDLTPRVQAAVFGLRLKYGNSYSAPAASGLIFADMTNTSFYGTKWAEQAYADGLLPNCGIDISSGKPLFCPDDLVSRGLAAYMIVRAKNLSMP